MALRSRLSVLVQYGRVWNARYLSDQTDSAGSVRSAGGSFGKREKAQEDQYFRHLEATQLRKLKEEKAQHHEEEIDTHKDSIRDLEDSIKKHKEKIRRHKKKLSDIDSDDDD